MSDGEWQPRYVAYARSHGRSPADQLAHDRSRYPGGKMAGFITWVHGQWREWSRLAGKDGQGYRTDADHEAFDAWLTSTYITECSKSCTGGE